MKPTWWVARARVSTTPGRISPSMERFMRRFAPLVRLAHRPVLDGTEHLPAAGPYILVANHSGGTAASEILSLATCWVEAFARTRPIACLAHPVAFWFWPATRIARGFGAVPATTDAARAALGDGIPLLVFPGGDHESSRPFWLANRVDFGGRRGFLRLAREAGAPIVPMGIRGSHWSAPILWRSTWLLPRLLVLPWVFGIRNWPVTLLAVAGAVAIGLVSGAWPWPVRVAVTWGWLTSPATFFPWVPSRIRFRIGPPIAATELLPTDDGGELGDAYRRVEGAVQGLVDDLGRAAPSGPAG